MSTTLDAEQVATIRRTFEQVAPIAEQAASLFYGRLFELDPTLRPMFTGDLERQGRKLMSALATVVAHAGNPRDLAATLEPLAVRHVGYGVEEHHYETVGAALIWTLETGLGPAFTDEVRDAWLAAYGAISETMIAAARASQLAESA